MSTQPTTGDTTIDEQRNTESLRVVALQHAARVSPEADLTTFLNNAAEVEKYLSTGNVPNKEK